MGVSSAESKRETSIIPLPPSLNLSPPAALEPPSRSYLQGPVTAGEFFLGGFSLRDESLSPGVQGPRHADIGAAAWGP